MPEHYLKNACFSIYNHSTIEARDILGVRWNYFYEKRVVKRPDKNGMVQ
jgi:hypothetical protein